MNIEENDGMMHDLWINYPNKLKLCRENYQLENWILQCKKPSCCSMWKKISRWDHVHFRLINIYKVTEWLIFIVLQLFPYKLEKDESRTWRNTWKNSLSQMLCKIDVLRNFTKKTWHEKVTCALLWY